MTFAVFIIQKECVMFTVVAMPEPKKLTSTVSAIDVNFATYI